MCIWRYAPLLLLTQAMQLGQLLVRGFHEEERQGSRTQRCRKHFYEHSSSLQGCASQSRGNSSYSQDLQNRTCRDWEQPNFGLCEVAASKFGRTKRSPKVGRTGSFRRENHCHSQRADLARTRPYGPSKRLHPSKGRIVPHLPGRKPHVEGAVLF